MAQTDHELLFGFLVTQSALLHERPEGGVVEIIYVTCRMASALDPKRNQTRIKKKAQTDSRLVSSSCNPAGFACWDTARPSHQRMGAAAKADSPGRMIATDAHNTK